MATRTNATASFGALSVIAALNTSMDDETPYALPNGTAIYVHSDRSNGVKIYRAEQNSASFDTPALVTGTNLETANQGNAVVSPDELTL